MKAQGLELRLGPGPGPSEQPKVGPWGRRETSSHTSRHGQFHKTHDPLGAAMSP